MADGPHPVGAVDTAPLFDGLHVELSRLLRGLPYAAWGRPTVAGAWTVGDVVAHLLDVQLRRLSFHRDSHPPPAAGPDVDLADFDALVGFLDGLNADWVRVARRLSPRVLMDLLDDVGPRVAALFRTLDPDGPAFFPVAWAGEGPTPAWLDVGRDYTELWHHQAQIRRAVGAPPLYGRPWLHPVLALSLRALPSALAGVERAPGTAVWVAVEGDAGGVWSVIRRPGGWTLCDGAPPTCAAGLRTDAETAWMWLYNALPADQVRRRLEVRGDDELGAAVMGARAVMVRRSRAALDIDASRP